MELKFDKNQLLEYLVSFYRLTRMRVVLFDPESHIICSYPESDCPFCQAVQGEMGLKEKCIESNEASFEECKKTGQLSLYRCHASLLESTTVLKSKGTVLGYAMIGQCSCYKDKKKRYEEMHRLLAKEGIDASKYQEEIDHLTYKNEEQYRSAAKILEALVNYLVLENFIRLNPSPFVQKLDSYLEGKLTEKIEVADLCRHFGYGRTKLYEMASLYLPVSISQYVSYYKMERAKQMLLEPYAKVVDVAHRLGYEDLNYFCRHFKKKNDCTPTEYKQKHA